MPTGSMSNTVLCEVQDVRNLYVPEVSLVNKFKDVLPEESKYLVTKASVVSNSVC
jgi:hypothetical protein